MKIRFVDECPKEAQAVAHFAGSNEGTLPPTLETEVERRKFKSGAGQLLMLPGAGRWVALVGVGDQSGDSWRQAGAALASFAGEQHCSSIAIDGERLQTSSARQLIEGAMLGAYQFDKYINEANRADHAALGELVIFGVTADDKRELLEQALATGQRSAEAVIFARDIANEPPAVCTPEFLAEQARQLSETFGFSCTVLDEHELKAQGFNLICAVGQGSVNPPRLIHMQYLPSGAVNKRIALVGKGVTYDSGGYSMKPSDYQINMHLDMGGAAAVLGAAYAIGSTGPKGVAVDFIIPTAENLVARDAFKVMDIIRGYSGTTVEIHNTDAEGRLLLADAIAYAEEQEPDVILDLATLTGACVVGLGQETAGVFGTDRATTAGFLDAAGRAAESVWELPLVERIESQLKSSVADVKNIGGRWGGAISAALFLRKFVDSTPWVHVDLAGPAMTDEAWSWINKGGTGFGVLALHEWIVGQGERTSRK